MRIFQILKITEFILKEGNRKEFYIFFEQNNRMLYILRIEQQNVAYFSNKNKVYLSSRKNNCFFYHNNKKIESLKNFTI